MQTEEIEEAFPSFGNSFIGKNEREASRPNKRKKKMERIENQKFARKQDWKL